MTNNIKMNEAKVLEYTVYAMIEGEMDIFDAICEAFGDIKELDGVTFTGYEQEYFLCDSSFTNAVWDEYYNTEVF